MGFALRLVRQFFGLRMGVSHAAGREQTQNHKGSNRKSMAGRSSNANILALQYRKKPER
jgi:hypothetical protein